MSSLKYLVILLTLFSFGTVINQVGGITPIIDIITAFICIAVIIKERITVNKKYVRAVLIIWVIVFLSMAMTHTSISFYYGFFFHTLLAVLIIICFRYNYDEINENIYKCSWLICYLGIINIFLYTFFPSLFVSIGSNTTNVKSIFFIFNYLPSGEGFIRNQGIFWEPGVFQIVLNLHLYNILIERNLSLKMAIVPIFLILSTLSTTGLLVMLIILFFWFVLKRKVKFSVKYTLLAAILGAILIPFVYNNIQDKFDNTHGSAALRAYDYYMGIEVIKRNPVWGIGMDPNEYIKRTTAVDLGYFDVTKLDVERGNTNTYISVAVMFGVPIALLFIVSLFKQNIFKRKRIIAVILALVFLSEPLFGQLFVFLLCFSSVKSNNKENCQPVLFST